MIAVGIDIDEVLANFTRGFSRTANAVLGTSFPDDFQDTDWDMGKVRGLTKAQMDEVWNAINADPQFWLSLDPMPTAPHALSLVSELRARGMLKVYFITARPLGVETLAQTQQWLALHGFVGATVVLSYDKDVVAQKLQLTHFVDDKPETCQAVKAAVPSCAVWLLSAPHNANAVLADVERVPDFATFVSQLLVEVA